MWIGVLNSWTASLISWSVTAISDWQFSSSDGMNLCVAVNHGCFLISGIVIRFNGSFSVSLSKRSCNSREIDVLKGERERWRIIHILKQEFMFYGRRVNKSWFNNSIVTWYMYLLVREFESKDRQTAMNIKEENRENDIYYE